MVEKTEFESGTFYLGDCFEVMEGLEAGSVDMVLTDIPYGEVNRKSGGLRSLDKGIADIFLFDLDYFVKEIVRISSGSFYVFCGIDQISSITVSFKSRKLTTRLAQWEKSNPSPMNGTRLWLSGSEFCVFARKSGAIFNEKCKKPIWKYPVGRNSIHPTQKPAPLFEEIMRVSSNQGQIVIDPFAGSGTTAIAAMNAGRRWICIEKDETYYRAAVERVRAHEAKMKEAA